MKRLLTITLLSTLLYIIGYAQNPMLRNYRASDYGGGTQNWYIDKTLDNRMLLANNDGLLEFDSHWWRSFPLPNYSNVRSVLFDHRRLVVWAGGSNEFGYFAMGKGNFVVGYHTLTDRLNAEERDFGEIWRIHEWGDDIVFQGRNRLFFLDARDSLTSISYADGIGCSAVVDGRLLLARHDGIYELRGRRDIRLTGTEAMGGKTVRAIIAYNKQLVFATAEQGLFIYDGQQAQPFLSQLTPFMAQNQLFCADIQGQMLAVGTVRRGLLLHNIRTGQTQYANSETGLQNNTVLSLRFDEQQNVWLGLDQGLSYVMPGFPSAYLLTGNSPIGTGYASLVTPSRLYLGTNQGVFSVSYPLNSSPTPPTPQLVGQLTGQTWELTNIDGTLLCGCNSGAYIIDGQQATRISGPEGTWHFIALSRHPGLVLASDYSGFYLLRRQGSGYVYDGRLQGFDESSGNFEEDEDGSVWVSHWQKGIYRLALSPDGHKVVKTEYFHKGNGLLLDAENLVCRIGGKVYVSSVDGFFSYDAKKHQLVHADRMNHIFDTYGSTLHLYETPDHDLWACKPGFLAIAHPQKDGTYTVDSTSYKNVERDMQMSLGHPSFTAQRQTILNSLGGFFLVDNDYEAQVQSSHIIFQGITGTNHGDTLLYACNPHPEEDTYVIPHSENSVRFSFVMPEYVRPKEIEYACYLEGYDRDWNAVTVTNEKEYTQLPKGTYTFHLKARNKITGATDERAIKIEILPAWYETWWARLLQLLFLAAVVWGVVMWVRHKENERIRQLQEKNEREMREQQKRNELEMKAQQAQFAMEQQKMEMEQQRLEMDTQRLEMEQQKKESELSRLRNEHLETELKHRQSELADSTMNLMRKNDMLQALDSQMDELSESVRREDTKARITSKIKEIRHDIQQNINEDEGWDKFEENFNLVYENFMKRLTAQFPDLKMSDRKLCAYLRMGLSSKEMASLLNTSVRSIETARYRLRKKLNMEQGDNLSEFIQNY